MSKRAGIAVGLCISVAVIGWADLPPRLQIMGFAGFGSILDGSQRDIPEDTLDPVPDAVSPLELRASIAFFPIQWVGLEAGYTYWGLVSANSAEVTQPLDLYDYRALSGGLVLRYPVYLFEDSYALWEITGGLRQSSIVVADEYEEVVAGGLPQIDTNPGWYVGGRGSMTYHWFMFGLQLEFIQDNSYFIVSGDDFDGTYFMLHLFLGLALFGS